MAPLSRFPRGTISRLSDLTWIKQLFDRLSHITLPEENLRLERSDSRSIPFALSIPNTPLRSTTPPNSPVSEQKRLIPHTLNCYLNYRLLGYDDTNEEVTANKIRVHVSIEVVTEAGDRSCQTQEIHPEISALNRVRHRTSKQRPRLHVRYAHSRSPTPIRPCPIEHVTRRSILDEDCSICSTSLASGPIENLVWCKGACGNNFHKSCFDQWRLYAARPLRCVHWYVLRYQ